MNLTVVSGMDGYAASAVGGIVIAYSVSVRPDIDAYDSGSLEDIQHTASTSPKGQAAVFMAAGSPADCSWPLLVQRIPV